MVHLAKYAGCYSTPFITVQIAFGLKGTKVPMTDHRRTTEGPPTTEAARLSAAVQKTSPRSSPKKVEEIRGDTIAPKI